MMRRRIARIFGLGLLAALAACTPGPPRIDPAAGPALKSLEARNRDLKTYKGIGDLRWDTGSEIRTARAAWAAALPAALRFSLLGPTGTPMLSIAADGKHLYALSHTEAELHRSAGADPGLKPVIGIPVRMREIIACFGGRIPLKAFGQAILDTDDGVHQVLILKNRWGKTVQKIYFEKDAFQAIRVEWFDGEGKPGATVLMTDFRDIDTYRIPFRLILNYRDIRFAITVDRFWTDVPVPDAAFVLTRPAA